MPRLVDRTGQRFGKLVVLKRNGTDNLKKVVWLCQCDCGNELNVVAGALVTKNTSSCGCVIPNFKHGGWNKPSYNTWRAMMRRCYNIKDKDYKRYGALGVIVCSEWHEYTKFAADMGEPSGDETLDRINPYGNYEINNCRWAGVKTQNRNVRVRASSRTKYVGVLMTGKKFMAKITIGKKAFYSKVMNSVEEAAAARKELERVYWANSR
jgi:hypothetical protein